MMFRREGRSRSISQRASLGSFATGSLLGFVRKMAAADPESAVVVVARAGNPDAGWDGQSRIVRLPDAPGVTFARQHPWSGGSWDLPFMPRNQPGRERVDDRHIISGILHVLTSGCRWRDCPSEYGLAPRSTTASDVSIR
jgi:hypothetical protein